MRCRTLAGGGGVALGGGSGTSVGRSRVVGETDSESEFRRELSA